MSFPPVRVNFVEDGRRRPTGALVVLSAGVLSVVAAVVAYQQVRDRSDGLELRLAALGEAAGPARGADQGDGELLAEAREAVAELATPWSRLLDELETAAADSRESVALLAVEPDRETLKVKIMAEARSLPDAIAFSQRLQRSEVLLHPLLDNHEVQARDRSRPVRFEITAAWRKGA